MTQFEQFLIDKGYLKFILNCKTMKYEPAESHTISTMSNLDHRYFHSSDPVIEQFDRTVYEIEYRKGEIIFGLHEVGKPPTLVYPRPIIKIKRKDRTETEFSDDSMNVVLSLVPHEEILKAMYDNTVIKIDLTND